MYWLRVMVALGRPMNSRIQSMGSMTMPMAPNTMNSTQPTVAMMTIAYTMMDTRCFHWSLTRLMNTLHCRGVGREARSATALAAYCCSQIQLRPAEQAIRHATASAACSLCFATLAAHAKSRWPRRDQASVQQGQQLQLLPLTLYPSVVSVALTAGLLPAPL